MQDVRAESWTHLQELLYEGAWKESLRRFRTNFAYRGMPVDTNDLRTSLQRQGLHYEQMERPMLRAFRKYAEAEASHGDSLWNWLAVAKHHDLPTRLLDWTYSPFVALHFATKDLAYFEQDAVIWCVDYVNLKERLPPPLRAILDDEGSFIFTAEMLGRAAGSLSQFGELATDDFVVFFEPPSLDERITNQFALFSLPSNPSMRLDDWLSAHPQLFRRIIVPAALKWEVRDKLDQANITERLLVGGLDGLSLWLKRYYMPRPPLG